MKLHSFPSGQRSLLFLILLNFAFMGSSNAQNSLWQDQNLGTMSNSRIDLGGGDSIAISIVRGQHEGPVFTIVAGIHGYEYPPIIAVQNFLQKIDPMDLSGTLVILPLANEKAFYGRSVFTNPADGKNLNREFPGSEKGTSSEKIAAYISKKIIPISDVFLDIHGGDASEDLLPFVTMIEKIRLNKCSWPGNSPWLRGLSTTWSIHIP